MRRSTAAPVRPLKFFPCPKLWRLWTQRRYWPPINTKPIVQHTNRYPTLSYLEDGFGTLFAHIGGIKVSKPSNYQQTCMCHLFDQDCRVSKFPFPKKSPTMMKIVDTIDFAHWWCQTIEAKSCEPKKNAMAVLSWPQSRGTAVRSEQSLRWRVGEVLVANNSWYQLLVNNNGLQWLMVINNG